MPSRLRWRRHAQQVPQAAGTLGSPNPIRRKTEAANEQPVEVNDAINQQPQQQAPKDPKAEAWAQKNGDSIHVKYLSKDSLQLVYKNHEIASHSYSHKDFKNINDDEILQEIELDIDALTKITKRKIVSMAYPFGNSSPHIAKLINNTGLTNARTVGDTYTFNLPDTFLLWRPTCHDSKALGLLDKYLSLNINKMSVFFVWGHSWEFNDAKRWANMSNFCNKLYPLI